MTIGIYDNEGCHESVCLAWVAMQILALSNHVVLDPHRMAKIRKWPLLPCQLRSCTESWPDKVDNARAQVLRRLRVIATGVAQ